MRCCATLPATDDMERACRCGSAFSTSRAVDELWTVVSPVEVLWEAASSRPGRREPMAELVLELVNASGRPTACFLREARFLVPACCAAPTWQGQNPASGRKGRMIQVEHELRRFKGDRGRGRKIGTPFTIPSLSPPQVSQPPDSTRDPRRSRFRSHHRTKQRGRRDD